MRKNDVVAGIFAVCLQVVNFAEVFSFIPKHKKGGRIFQRSGGKKEARVFVAQLLPKSSDASAW